MPEIFKHTPYWVFIVFAVILYFGVAACKPNRMSRLRILLLPAVFTVVSIYGVVANYGWAQSTLIGWFGGVFLASLPSYVFSVTRPEGFSVHDGFLWVPREYGILVVSFIFIGATCWFAYVNAVDPYLSFGWTFRLLNSLSIGMLVGFIGGRGTAHFVIYQRLGSEIAGKHTDHSNFKTGVEY